MLFLHLIIVIILGLILLQDFRYRAISWIAVVVLGSIYTYMGITDNGFEFTFRNSIINIVFLLINLIVLFAFVSLKSKRFVNIFRGHTGSGDWLFLSAAAIAFSPALFIVYFTASILISLFLFGLLLWMNLVNDKRVPLAGLMALPLMGLEAAQLLSESFRINDDRIVLNWLTAIYV